MPISVIASIRIHPKSTKDDSDEKPPCGEIIEKSPRHEIETCLVNLAGRGFSYFERVTERSVVHIFGQFESLNAVYVNPESIKNLGHFCQLEGLGHYEFCINSVMADADLLELHSFYVKKHLKSNFEQQLKDSLGVTTRNSGRLVCGWRTDPEGWEEYIIVFAVNTADRELPLSNHFNPLREFACSVGSHRIRRFTPCIQNY